MRFSVDAHAIGRHLTGNEVYIRNLLQRFDSLDPEADFIAYVSVKPNGAIPTRFAARRVSRNPFIRLGFDLGRNLRRDRPDLIHVQYTAPLSCPVPIIVSIHDVSFLEHPEFFTYGRVLQLRNTVSQTINRATKVLTPSEFSRRAIERAYNLEPGKVVVIPNAVAPVFRPLPRSQALARVQALYGIPGPFILAVGDLQPRKNHAGLIRAFDELITNFPQLPHHLVIVGKDTWHAPAVHSAATRSRVSSRIHFTGFVPDEDLLQFYAACDVSAFPSFYEGFGFPILEAMACGRALVCANTSAIPEVADSAALLFDPYSTGEMVRALADLLLDTQLRTRMERLGLRRAALFSWEKAARKTLEVYYEVAGIPLRQFADAASPARI